MADKASGHTPDTIPFDAGWPHDLRHRPDPNRVTAPRAAAGGQLGPPAGSAALARPPSDRPPATGVATSRQVSGNPQDPQSEPSYYDISILKAPLWKWEIACYFFLGGLSAGAYTIGRLAERHGGGKHREVSRTAAYLALASFLPCPPLLIHDLGDPKRFHHMLRVFKPSSPMSLGTWAIMGYSGIASAEAFRQWMLDRFPPSQRGAVLRTVNSLVELGHDAAGIPFAMLVAGYTGVLLSSTSNPLWSKNKWLGPLFTASAVATGAAATSLTLSATAPGGGSEHSHEALEKVDTAAHVAEAVCLHRFLKEAGPKAKSLTRGKMKRHLGVVVGGLILGELLKLIPFGGRLSRLRRRARTISSLLSLASGFSLRWAMVHGGHEAANDPHTARLSSRPGGRATGDKTKG